MNPRAPSLDQEALPLARQACRIDTPHRRKKNSFWEEKILIDRKEKGKNAKFGVLARENSDSTKIELFHCNKRKQHCEKKFLGKKVKRGSKDPLGARSHYSNSQNCPAFSQRKSGDFLKIFFRKRECLKHDKYFSLFLISVDSPSNFTEGRCLLYLSLGVARDCGSSK